ncbi:DUF397 domain-containing protein [Streptomyces sp. NPDC005794]|uniref:DUF397 domain-containing protein n=1 Tax=Streptomyces sp. NPDC005794 TaxID=3364733 RepID=UPI0036832547
MIPEIVGLFQKSSYSDQQGDCVEVAHTANGGRAVRDSKDPSYGAQFHAPGAWGAFLGAVKDGRLLEE